MYTISAKEARNEFSALIDSVRNDPVQIQKNGKPVAVVISVEDYERFEMLDDLWWTEKAKKAKKQGYLSVKESDDIIQAALSAKPKAK
jgi:antitoxin Phd